MHPKSRVVSSAAQARLQSALARLAVPIPRTRGQPLLWPHPRTTAQRRPCPDAAANALFTDIEAAAPPPQPAQPAIRLPAARCRRGQPIIAR